MAKPKLALIPAAQGTSLYSVLPSSGVGDFDFTRSGSATRINSQGLIETVASGVSRLNYPLIDGKVVGCPSHLLEPARTNLLQYSEDFSNAAWVKTNVTLTSSNVISPDGTQNASKIEATASDSSLQDSITVTSGTTYTLSVYLKTVSGTLDTAIGLGSPGFPQNEGEGGRYKNITVTNEWKRYTLTSTADASAATGIGVGGFNSFSTGEEVYVWGVQLEQGSYPTSYIPTSGSAVTRSAETANGAGDASTFNDSEGVLMAEISALANDGGNRILSINNGTQSERIIILYTSTNNQIRCLGTANGATQFDISFITSDVTLFSKISVKYKNNNFALWVNGFEIGTDTNGNIPSGLSKLSFNSGTTAAPFYGKTKQLQYYDTALTDSELETLTSWVSFEDMAISQQYSLY